MPRPRTKEAIREAYFEWLIDLVDGDKYTHLLRVLNSIEFHHILPMDENRTIDGLTLRYNFGNEMHISEARITDALSELLPNGPLGGRCTMLEMMAALASRCESSIMHDEDYGNRTGEWFLEMLDNVGISYITDRAYANGTPYEKEMMDTHIHDGVDRVNKRQYSPKGRGGLFYVKHPPKDMRDVEIWYQMNWKMNEILGVYE